MQTLYHLCKTYARLLEGVARNDGDAPSPLDKYMVVVLLYNAKSQQTIASVGINFDSKNNMLVVVPSQHNTHATRQMVITEHELKVHTSTFFRLDKREFTGNKAERTPWYHIDTLLLDEGFQLGGTPLAAKRMQLRTFMTENEAKYGLRAMKPTAKLKFPSSLHSFHEGSHVWNVEPQVFAIHHGRDKKITYTIGMAMNSRLYLVKDNKMASFVATHEADQWIAKRAGDVKETKTNITLVTNIEEDLKDSLINSHIAPFWLWYKQLAPQYRTKGGASSKHLPINYGTVIRVKVDGKNLQKTSYSCPDHTNSRVLQADAFGNWFLQVREQLLPNEVVLNGYKMQLDLVDYTYFRFVRKEPTKLEAVHFLIKQDGSCIMTKANGKVRRDAGKELIFDTTQTTQARSRFNVLGNFHKLKPFWLKMYFKYSSTDSKHYEVDSLDVLKVTKQKQLEVFYFLHDYGFDKVSQNYDLASQRMCITFHHSSHPNFAMTCRATLMKPTDQPFFLLDDPMNKDTAQAIKFEVAGDSLQLSRNNSGLRIAVPLEDRWMKDVLACVVVMADTSTPIITNSDGTIAFPVSTFSSLGHEMKYVIASLESNQFGTDNGENIMVTADFGLGFIKATQVIVDSTREKIATFSDLKAILMQQKTDSLSLFFPVDNESFIHLSKTMEPDVDVLLKLPFLVNANAGLVALYFMVMSFNLRYCVARLQSAIHRLPAGLWLMFKKDSVAEVAERKTRVAAKKRRVLESDSDDEDVVAVASLAPLSPLQAEETATQQAEAVAASQDPEVDLPAAVDDASKMLSYMYEEPFSSMSPTLPMSPLPEQPKPAAEAAAEEAGEAAGGQADEVVDKPAEQPVEQPAAEQPAPPQPKPQRKRKQKRTQVEELMRWGVNN